MTKTILMLASTLLFAVACGSSDTEATEPDDVDGYAMTETGESAAKTSDDPDYARADRRRGDRANDDADATGGGEAPLEADNTGNNERDVNADTATPTDQSNSQSDIDITASIRRELMDAEDLSFTAKNVKIITENGRVTLRGPVESATEKSLIVARATKVAGAGNVVDQLEVERD